MDVGSTTVKAVVINPDTKEILWSDYQRHHTKQPEKVLELCEAIIAAFPDHPWEKFRMFVTGSGSGPLEKPTGGKFATTSMNDKCASGTGATIDKCMIKVGAEPGFATSLHFSDEKLHHVAAKCGVFAETDIVNLV